MDYGISISPAQMRKLKSGGAITMKPSNFDESSKMRLAVMPQTSRRIQTALKKMKGVRVALKGDEDVMAMTEGGMVSMVKEGGATYAQRLARRTRRAFAPVERAAVDIGRKAKKTGEIIKRGFNKEIVDSGIGKEIAKGLIRAGTDVILPTALGGLSMLAGDPTGMSGQMVGDIAGSYIKDAAERGGYGVGKRPKKVVVSEQNGQMVVGGSTYKQRVARRAKNTFKQVGRAVKKIISDPIIKDLGKRALRSATQRAGEALGAATGNPALAIALERVATKAGDELIDTGDLRKSGRVAKGEATRAVNEVVDDVIEEIKMAQQDIPMMFSGYGIPKKTRGGLRMGMGMKMRGGKDCGCMMMGSGFTAKDGRMITSGEAPSSVIQTGSPFQRKASPAMTPFIASSPQLSGFKQGGSFLPAGVKVGGSFVPAG